MRWMGLDFGTKTVGVAISDELGITAQPIETITRKSNTKLRKTLARIEQLALEYRITEIVLGYPKNMNNSEGARVEATREFGEMIKKRLGLPLVLWDERLTTMESERILIETNIRRENRKAYIDQMAAVLILQSYMDARTMREKEELDG